MNTRHNQRGDTILEVLIAIAILSLVLATSFALANRSTQANRQAAERGEAYKVAVSEMEKLKLYLSSSSSVTLPEPGTYFCMNDEGSAIEVIGDGNDAPANPNDDIQFTSSIYTANPNCRADINTNYYHFIQRGEAGDQENTYTSTVRWVAVTGNGVDQASIVHRVYPDQASLVVPGGSAPIPLPSNYSETRNGNTGTCNALPPFCAQVGSGMYMLGTFMADFTFPQPPTSTMRVQINYQNYDYAGIKPRTGYEGYRVQIQFIGSGYSVTETLPVVTSPSNSGTYALTVPLSPNGPKTLRISWLNDDFGVGYDANLQINSVRVFN